LIRPRAVALRTAGEPIETRIPVSPAEPGAPGLDLPAMPHGRGVLFTEQAGGQPPEPAVVAVGPPSIVHADSKPCYGRKETVLRNHSTNRFLADIRTSGGSYTLWS